MKFDYCVNYCVKRKSDSMSEGGDIPRTTPYGSTFLVNPISAPAQ